MEKYSQLLSIALFTLIISACKTPATPPSFTLDKKQEAAIEKTLSSLSLEEKVGQTCQITLDAILKKDSSNTLLEPHQIDDKKLSEAINKFKVGSVLNVSNHTFSLEKWNGIINRIQKEASTSNSKIPVIYGVDAIHGATYIKNSTLFPQEIGLAASWDTSLASEMGEVTAYETRASGVPWNFSPVLDQGRVPLWSRFFETLGEDVYLTKTMGSKIILGYQGLGDIDNKHVAACLKHFVGYGFPRTGRDRTPALIPERTMKEHHLPPFEKAIKAGALTVMINSGEVNGIPGHANKHLLTTVLKEEWGFSGFTVSDWEDFIKLYKEAQTDSTIKDAIATGINSGVDMSMVPNNPEYKAYCSLLIELVNEKRVSVARLDDAVRRILRVKHKLGLFEEDNSEQILYSDFGSKKHTDKAYRAAAESITLLKNKNNILPLNKNQKIMVIGPTSNSLNCLNGAWTHTWQGVDDKYNNTEHPTILEAIKIAAKQTVHYNGSIMVMENGDEKDYPSVDLKKAVKEAKNYDVAVVCIGELPSTERPGDIYSLDMAKEQLNIVHELSKTGIPIVLVLVEGRPKIINSIEPLSSAVLQAYLPGDQGGRAVADILFGAVNPSGKLPYTYPRHSGVIMHYDHKQSELINGNSWKNDFFNPQWNFGYGQSYTSFEYSSLSVNKSELSINKNEELTISVNIKNTGDVSGKEIVQLYTRDHYASISPPLKKLCRYTKISLSAGETKKVSFKVKVSDLGFYGLSNEWTNEIGTHSFYVGGLEEKITLAK
jgi:beta-glucosidase